MIDTHSHIFGPEFDDDRAEVVRRAKDAGVNKVLLANVDTNTIGQMKRCREEYPDFTAMAMGLHPTEIRDCWKDDLRQIYDELQNGDYVAVGEIGLDFYWDRNFEKEQREVMRTQMAWALEMNLPVILHIRKAYAEAFEVLSDFGNRDFHGVFHCFSGGLEEAKKAIRMGFFLGIGGVLTYKNSTLGDIIREVGLEHLLLETDAPYLAPVPYRGKRNEPAFMTAVRDKMSEIFNQNAQVVDEITTKNARNLFGI
ncbi:MAG: TatD family hydrolase [Paludibacteraceae bacterium]|nr:TatD family hydrolase [Paludibacteraceae bacterium]